MSELNMIDTAKLVEQFSRFTAFVQYKNGQPGAISFRDSSGFLGREEDYKSRIAEEARKELKFSSWTQAMIGAENRTISECAKKAMNRAGNLVNMNQQVDFKNRLDPAHPNYPPEAERVLYDIYRNQNIDEATAFANAVKTFGAKYDTIAFLFFIKDDTRFLPISTGHFDKGFKILNIDFSTSHQCSWENYCEFIRIISEIRRIMEDTLPMVGTPRLIDAHSFIWVIQEDRVIQWTPDAEQAVQIETTAEELIQGIVSGTGGRRSVTSTVFSRSAEVVKETRKRANGICQFCGQPAPFTDKHGNPYLEVHHIIWLSRGGEDSTANTAALCPNCHTRMHILDKQEDIDKLLNVAKSLTSGN